MLVIGFLLLMGGLEMDKSGGSSWRPRVKKTASCFVRWRWLAMLGMTGLVGSVAVDGEESTGPIEPSYRAVIEADWTLQEERKGRRPDDPEAVQGVYRSALRLLDDLDAMTNGPNVQSLVSRLECLEGQVRRAGLADRASRLALYREIRWVAREAAFENPSIASKPIVFLKRRRFISQMLHEYLGYFYDYGDIAGGGVHVLDEPGRSFNNRDLVAGRLPRGNYTTLSLSYDATTIYFAFAERAAEKPDYYSSQRRSFHVFAMDADGENLRQLTHGPDDDFDPCPLPDGDLVLMSTRRGGFGRCHNPWEPLPAYTLHRMDASGRNLRTLSFHETNQWHPSVLRDGRIVYTRWDYVDRSAAHFHGLWTSNPDGTNPSILFGNYTQRINACYQPRAIPGSRRIMFVAGAHHAAVGGSLVIVDPAQTGLDRATGQDSFESIEVLTPEVCFPEAPGWPSSYFHSPWPLSENYFLVSFSFDPLPGMGPKVERDTSTGLYYLDRFGNMELIYRDEGISCMYPIPLARRPLPSVLPASIDAALGDEGELVLSDIRKSLMRLPEDREICELRVFQVLPKTETHVADKPKIGYARAESARMLLGSVPVEADGSAYFRVPAGKPIYFQAVDDSGRAVQSMRSVVYLQPGQRLGCVGCHEPPGTSPESRPLLALRRPASTISPGPEGSMPFSFPRLVQPVLDRHCVSCHDGSQGPDKSPLVLTGQRQDRFTRSYQNLRAFARWYEWGQDTITPIVTRPGHSGADESPLTRILTDEIHGDRVKLPDEDLRRLYAWLDGNAPFYGTYSQSEQDAQLAGEMVPPPGVQ
jgi:hydrazine synthase alpha subunit-like protein